MGSGPSKPATTQETPPQQPTNPTNNPTITTASAPKQSTFFAKKGIREGFTDNYGDSVNMISFMCAIYARLAYMNDHQFLGHYQKIFGPIIPEELMTMMNTQVSNNGINSILNDTQMFGEKTFDLEPFKSKPEFGGQGLQFLPWAQKINIINGEQRIDANNANCGIEVDVTLKDINLVFVTVATSNYSQIYVVGDKRMPNIVTVIFTGTSDAKSAGSYSKPSSISAMWTGNIKGMTEGLDGKYKEKYLFGVYKILMDCVHTLMDSINYVAEKINPNAEQGKVNIISTGHSLGGALATIFAYVYISHISNLPNHLTSYPKLNINIACISLGSPRVFSKNLANHFCYLTKNNEEAFKDNLDFQNFIKTVQIFGRITYLRIVSFGDPVPMVPKIGFSHPCSDLTPIVRKNTNVDCLVQIENSLSTRCAASKRLAMTYNFQDLPLLCVDTKEARENAQKDSKTKSPSLMKNPMSYHTEYLGISYIGGISLSNVFGKNIGRVRETIDTNKKGETVCRLLFYPSIDNDINSASVGFYDLTTKKNKSNLPALNTSDEELEAAEATEESGLTPIKADENTPQPTVTAAPSNEYSKKVLDIFKNMTEEKMVEVPEDIYDTEQVFEQIIKQTTIYNILTDATPPIKYESLITIAPSGEDKSFESGETIVSPATVENNIYYTPEGVKMPYEDVNELYRRHYGGKKRTYKRNKRTRRARKTRKTKKHRKRKTKKRRN